MLKQQNDEEKSGENGKGMQNTEPTSLASCKRASNEFSGDIADEERKRVRINAASEGVEVSKSSGTEQCHAANMSQDRKETTVGEVPKSGQLEVRTAGFEVVAKQADEVKLVPLAKGSRGVREMTPSHKIVTTLIADVAEDRGSRHTMEDAWALLPQAWLGTPGNLRLAHFAIYDGHGGRHAAEYARAHLHANILSAGLPRESMDIKGVKRAILEGFKTTDDALLRESSSGGWQDGATVVSVWVLGQMVFVANLGDAKAVLARAPVIGEGDASTNSNAGAGAAKEAPLKGVIVTKEHKAIFPQERARIEKAGGFVESNGRLLGRLEVSRAFGDRNFKKAGVTAVPDVQKFELSERERFLILGCDGLWGVFGPSDAVEFVAGQLKDGVTVGVACRRLIREAVRERKCKDNCTAVVILFEHSHI